MVARDPEGTKRRILAAAEREFSAKGISGGRVAAIADRAKVNKRMLYHYFGSKDGLFRALLGLRLADRADKMRASALRTPTERLLARAEHFGKDRVHVRLLMWEALEAGRRTAELEERREIYEAIIDEVRRDQEAGDVPPDLDPAQWALTELALTMFPAAFPQVTKMMTGQSPSDPQFVEDRAEFLRRYQAHLAGRTETGARRAGV